MISQCYHCQKELKFSAPQTAKIKNALAKLPPGKLLKFACPYCKKQIELNGDSSHQPEVPAPPGNPTPTRAKQDGGGNQKEKPAPVVIKPPDPPDLSWLTAGEMAEEKMVEDVPTAMLMVKAGGADSVSEALKEMGYQIYRPETAEEAIDSMRFKDYAAVVYQCGFESGGLKDSLFHAHMSKLSMTKRRYIFYTLIGPDFRTLYDLEALAVSANMVVNETELSHVPVLLKKGKRDYEELFGPYVAMLKAHGKR